MSLFLSLLHLFSFFFIHVAMAAAPSDISHPSCPSYDNCDNVIIKYPFWRKDVQISTQTQSQYCGYEGFEIICRENRPTIELENDLYYVRNISYEKGVINLVDDDVIENTCPRVRHEIGWQGLPFNFSADNVKLSFHFNCSGALPPFASEIGCMDLGTGNKSCVSYEAEAEAEDWDWGNSCQEEVVTWVLRGRRPRRLGSEYGGELRNGFQLSWGTEEGCRKCEDSDGRCGYNWNTEEYMCFCSDGRTTTGDCRKGSKIKWKLKLLIGILSSFLPVLLFIIYCCMKSSSSNCAATFRPKTGDDTSVEAFIQQYGSLSTKRYTYVDIKKITNSFQAKLGQGGFGTVFKGKLSDGRLVAVKVLSSSKASGQEFINEVASIGRTSHVNIVSLLGFCFDHKKRALIYEFMPNGSLEKFISGHVPPEKSLHIGVDKLYDVAIGIARGLDYLHRGCNVRILHLDIKPHNILLDEDFCPKIADFGLAKLYSRKESIVSMLEARGTIGYIAPEVFNRNFGGVSHKSDVYSYGMLILEMVGGRKNIDASVDSGHSSEIYFPDWIYNRLKEDKFLLDSATTTEENDYARKMTVVGLWCIQANPMQRPSINDVIEMLEGSMEALKVPPKPVFSSPPRSTITIFNTSEEELGSS